MNEKLNFKVVMRFFESPNFNLTSDGEEVLLARANSRESAEAFARMYALEILREYYGRLLHDFSECNGDFTVDFDGDDFCVVRFDEYIANIINIVEEEDSAVYSDCGYVFGIPRKE